MRIDAYEFGKIEIEGRTYTSDVIIGPEKVMDSWWRKEGHRLHVDDLQDIMKARPQVVVIGTGYFGRMRVPNETREYLEARGVEVREAETSRAVEEFNRLQQEYARVVGALHLTC